MEIKNTRIGFAFVLVLLFFSILTLLYWDFVRDAVIIPIYYVLWLGNLLLKSISQDIYLILFALVSLVIGINTFINAGRQPAAHRAGTKPYVSSSRYTHWRRLTNNLYASSVTKAGFVREARRLILSILAYQNGLEIEEVEHRINNQELPVPDAIRTLIQKRQIKNLKPIIHRRKSLIVRLRRRFFKEEVVENPPIDASVLEIVTYIEHLLEIKNVTN